MGNGRCHSNWQCKRHSFRGDGQTTSQSDRYAWRWWYICCGNHSFAVQWIVTSRGHRFWMLHCWCQSWILWIWQYLLDTLECQPFTKNSIFKWFFVLFYIIVYYFHELLYTLLLEFITIIIAIKIRNLGLGKSVFIISSLNWVEAVTLFLSNWSFPSEWNWNRIERYWIIKISNLLIKPLTSHLHDIC